MPVGYSDKDRELAVALGQRMRQRREELGMSAPELTRMTTSVGASSNMTAIERGRNLPRPLLLAEIAVALDVTTDWLLGISDKKPQTSGGLDSYTAGYRACFHDVQDKLAELKPNSARRRKREET